MIEIIKTIILGIIEGLTEWLPISSTGHMILVDEFLKLNVSAEFKEMFLVVIQLGAILSVIVLYFKELWPIKRDKVESKKTWTLWFKILVASIPAGIIGVLFDDILDKYLYNYVVVAIMLIVYGILFLILERKERKVTANTCEEITYKQAFIIGLFQILGLVPGTSRSGATIIGGMTNKVSRSASAKFTFFLAIPVMLGASALKLLKFGFDFTSIELGILITGFIVAFIVSLISIRFLVSYVKKHNFKAFGYYRIILGLLVLLYFGLIR